MKAGRAFEFRVSPLLTAEIDAWLEIARPIFPNGDDPSRGPLWLTWRGKPPAPHTLTEMIAAVTKRNLKARVTPHRFRHAATTTMARARGFDARHSQSFLDHKLPGTSERHYNLATELDARRDFQELLETKYLGPARKRR